jgi:hypothetical protein
MIPLNNLSMLRKNELYYIDGCSDLQKDYTVYEFKMHFFI